MCVRRTSDAQLQTLDLSSLECMANGAEPINAAIISQFYKKFSITGLREGVICPCYGLAESTVLVSVKPILEPHKVVKIDPQQLAVNKVVLTDKLNAINIVSSGVPKVNIKIVKEDQKTLCQPMEVGEIWVSGPRVF